MDSNKDEGERCIRLAERFLEVGEIDQAFKYLKKAERLYPSQRAKGRPLEIFTVLRFY
jgi:DnaJ homolog subfamily B member 12